MRLVITDSIFVSEFESFQRLFNLDCIKEASKKALQGLGKTIKNSNKLKGSILKKINLTSTAGAGRAVFLIIVENGDCVLVVVRHKNDKKIGFNTSIENPYFEKLLNKNLDLIIGDLENNNFKSYNL